MSLKILIKRDSIDNFATSDFIPRERELTVAYSSDDKHLVFKLGDGKTPWSDLCEVTKISELSSFNIYTDYNTKPTVELFLDPFKIREVLDATNEARVTYEA